MDIKPIKTDEDHCAALAEVEALWGATDSTPEGDRLDVLVTLIEAYEEKRWPIEAAMQHDGHSQADLAALIGKSRATEILKRQRALTLPMIRRISTSWHVPERLLVKEYQIQGRAA
jgi:HTH-type transcriptional regulator/antitoxin HigA